MFRFVSLPLSQIECTKSCPDSPLSKQMLSVLTLGLTCVAWLFLDRHRTSGVANPRRLDAPEAAGRCKPLPTSEVHLRHPILELSPFWLPRRPSAHQTCREGNGLLEKLAPRRQRNRIPVSLHPIAVHHQPAVLARLPRTRSRDRSEMKNLKRAELAYSRDQS